MEQIKYSLSERVLRVLYCHYVCVHALQYASVTPACKVQIKRYV